MMRRLLLPLALLAMACGDISNEAVDDLSFVQALPRADDLRLAAPAGEPAPAPSSAALGTTRSPLRICSRPLQLEPLCEGVRIANGVNRLTAAVLLSLDAVQSLEPAERRKDRRTWGPFIDARGNEKRLVVERERGAGGYDYRWRVEVRGAGTWLPLVEGGLRPGARMARRGAGYFTWDPTEARAAGIEEGDPAAQRLEIRYDLGSSIHVEADAAFDGSDLPAAIAFVQDIEPTAEGSWQYGFPWTVAVTGQPVDAEVRARWQADGAGRSDARFVLSDGALTVGSELCWDARLERTYFRSDDPAQCLGGICPEGQAATCAFPSLFP